MPGLGAAGKTCVQFSGGFGLPQRRGGAEKTSRVCFNQVTAQTIRGDSGSGACLAFVVPAGGLGGQGEYSGVEEVKYELCLGCGQDQRGEH